MIFRYVFLPVLCILLTLLSCDKKDKVIEENPDPIDTTSYYKHEDFIMGADLSYTNVLEKYGAKYFDQGKQKDPFKIFKDYGTNLIRVRIWNDPIWQKDVSGSIEYSYLKDVEQTIKRAKSENMAVLLDFHYSDDWADPQKQYTPLAWKNANLQGLKDSIYNYTLSTLDYLKSKKLTPEYVQVGNETNPGMCHPIGKINGTNFNNFGELLKSGIAAIRKFSVSSDIKPKIMIHCAQLQDAGWWLEGVVGKAGVNDFDIIGLSHYFKWSEIKTMDAIKKTLGDIKIKYNKDVVIVETAFPWTSSNADTYQNIFDGIEKPEGYNISKEDQLRYMHDLTQILFDTKCNGIIYWEPTWISSTFKDRWGQGSSWENNAYFDFDGSVLPVIRFMKDKY